MTDYIPIPLGLLSDSDNFSSGRVLKAYNGGTTTGISMYTDYTGGTPATKVIFNSSGLPTISGSVVMPHIASTYPRVKYVLYTNETDADANTNALQTFDNIPTVMAFTPSGGSATSVISFLDDLTVDTKSDLKALTPYITGQTAYMNGRAAIGDGGEGLFRWDSSDLSTEVTADTLEGIYIAPTSDTSGASGAWVRQDITVYTPQMFGALGDGATDDLASITAAIVATPVGGTLLFPPGTYDVSDYIPVLRNDITIKGGPGVVINNTNVSAGYPSDGIRVGNAAAVEGEGGTNTSPYTYTENVHIDGFTFTNCRIGLWFVYSKRFSAKNIQADSAAAVACGNDAYDDCYQFELKNITQLSWANKKGGEDFYIVGIYRCYHFTVDGVYQLEGMATTTNAAAITINNSTHYSIENAHIDQETSFSNGIVLTGGQYFSIGSSCTVDNTKSGIQTFPGNNTDMYGTISGVVTNSTNGIYLTCDYTTVKSVVTKGCTTDLYLATDAAYNLIEGCVFNPNGTAVIVEETSGGNNGINLQKWRNNITGNSSLGIEGDADGYVGGTRIVFRAVSITTVPNATGDGTYYPITGWATEVFDGNNNFNPTTGIFTAPIDGYYQFEGTAGITGVTTGGGVFVRVAGVDHYLDGEAGAANIQPSGTLVLHLLRSQTAQLVAYATGGAKTASVQNYIASCAFSGRLLF